jgi:RimJ/RimL family protein N-acetyltransferase
VPDRRPSPADRARRTAARLSSRGPGEIAGLARDRVREWIRSDEKLIVLVRDAGAETPPLRHDGELAFRAARPDDGALYARAIGTDSAATFRRRLTPTTSCFLVERAGALLHASWVTTGAAWTREIRAYVVPPPGDAYVYESFTSPDARGRGVYPFALAGICRWAQESGVARVWVAVESGNAPSYRAITKAGFEPCYSIQYGRRAGRLRVEVEQPAGVTIPAVSKAPPA